MSVYIRKNDVTTKIQMPSVFPSNKVTYDNTISGLSATNAKDAIDELTTEVNSKVINPCEIIIDWGNGVMDGYDPNGGGTFYLPLSDWVWRVGDTMTGDLTINTADGTVSTVGVSRIRLGNNTPQGTAGNAKGAIRLYGMNGYACTIHDAIGLTAPRELHPPNETGTIETKESVNRKNYRVTCSGVTNTNAVTITDIDGNTFTGGSSLLILQTNTSANNCSSAYLLRGQYYTTIVEGSHARAPRIQYSSGWQVKLNTDTTARTVYGTIIDLNAYSV